MWYQVRPDKSALSNDSGRMTRTRTELQIEGGSQFITSEYRHLSFKRLRRKLTHLDKHVFMLRVPNNEGALPILFTLHELKAT